ncbi:hypothetical protein [Flavisphingomonas formosensis]|uniref:hypothetical protein n=1 Tax=Flavisphingomonas formosensis TaxID=861534 RepID=UPI0012F7A89A|nr:hypothetical protein [Sphingomonas formosensis]
MAEIVEILPAHIAGAEWMCAVTIITLLSFKYLFDIASNRRKPVIHKTWSRNLCFRLRETEIGGKPFSGRAKCTLSAAGYRMGNLGRVSIAPCRAEGAAFDMSDR